MEFLAKVGGNEVLKTFQRFRKFSYPLEVISLDFLKANSNFFYPLKGHSYSKSNY